MYTQRYKANPYFGVEPHCERRLLKESSFNGESYLEVKSQPLKRSSSFGFKFQTYMANGVLLLSTFFSQSSRADAKNYYSVSLIDGKLQFKMSSAAGRPLTFVSTSTYNDGQIHSVFLTKSDNQILIYVNDEVICNPKGLYLEQSGNEIPAPSNNGLFIGGIPFLLKDVIERANQIGSVNGLVGTISDIVFIDDEYVRHRNVQLNKNPCQYKETHLFLGPCA